MLVPRRVSKNNSVELTANVPSKWCLEDEFFLFGVSAYFQVRFVSFREGIEIIVIINMS